MSTGTDIVKRALQQIGASSAVSEPSADALDTGFDKLNGMISLWSSKGIQTGATPLNVIGDELNEKSDCRDAIIDNLSIRLAPDFDNGKQIVSQDLRANARRGLAQITSLYGTFTVPDKVVSSTLPKGQGNRRFTRNTNDAFFHEGEKIGN
jgi:hypothetical protein